MAVTRLNSTNVAFTTGTPDVTYTPDGAATIILAQIAYTNSNAGTASAFSVGGNAFTRLTFARNATGDQSNAEIWWAAAFGGSGLTVAITTTGTPASERVTIHSLGGAGTPVTVNTDAHNASTALSAAVSCAVGDFVAAVGECGRSGVASSAWGNSFTSQFEGASYGRSAMGYKIAVGTSETATITMAGSSASFSAALAVCVVPALGGSTAGRNRMLMGFG